MAFLKEFKEFALKGNVMDMAVGVIIGGAFGKIVSSLVNDILMPPIGALIGNTDFSQLRLDISKFRDMTSSAVHAVGDVVTGGGEAAAKAACSGLAAKCSQPACICACRPCLWVAAREGNPLPSPAVSLVGLLFVRILL